MPPKAVQRTKEQKLAAALAGSRKTKKKKWAKGKVREKKENQVIFHEDSYEAAVKEVPKLRTITVATVSEKLRVTGSLATRLIRKLSKDGLIKKVYDQSGFLLYCRIEGKTGATDTGADTTKGGTKGGKKGGADIDDVGGADVDIEVADVEENTQPKTKSSTKGGKKAVVTADEEEE